nr:NADH dehydrogenase subunit 4L [Chroodactylon ornatum]
MMAFLLLIVGFLIVYLNRDSLLGILFGLEVCSVGLFYCFVIVAFLLDCLLFSLFSLLVLAVGAAEIALGLALVVLFARVRFSLLLSEKIVLLG